MLVHNPFDISEIFHPKKKLVKLLWSGAARRVAVTLLMLFSSIYVYQIFVERGVGRTGAILSVVLFHLILRLSKLITLIYAEDLSRRGGFVRVLKVSIVPFLLFIYTLLKASSHPNLFYLAAILWGVHAGFYWWGFHGYFVKTQDKHHFGRDIGEMMLLRTLAVIVTPFLGGLVVSYFDFSAAFILAGAFMIFAVVFFDTDEKIGQKTDTDLKEVLSLIIKHKSVSLAYAGLAAGEVIYSIAWPLFLFFIFGEVLSLGGIVSLAAFFAAAFNVLAGDRVDKQGEHGALLIGTITNITSWLMRFVGVSFTLFVVSDSLWNFGQKLSNLALTELSYKKAINKVSARAILFRETALILGAIFALLVIALVVILTSRIEYSFLFGAIFAGLPLISIIKKRV